MKKILIWLLIGIFIFLIPQFASAEKSEWINEDYDFSKIKKILIISAIPDEAKNNVFDKYLPNNYPKVIIEKLKEKNQNLTVHTFMDACKLLDQETEGKFTQLLNAKSPEALPFLKTFADDYYDATIFVNFLCYNYSSQSYSGHSYQVQGTTTSSVYNSTGKYVGSVSTPTTTTYSVPGGNMRVANVQIDFSVVDTKTNNIIFGRNEARMNAPRSTVEGVSRRIGGSMVDKLTDLIKDGVKTK